MAMFEGVTSLSGSSLIASRAGWSPGNLRLPRPGWGCHYRLAKAGKRRRNLSTAGHEPVVVQVRFMYLGLSRPPSHF